jgi:membrane protease YdiL (CAAX protease family)
MPDHPLHEISTLQQPSADRPLAGKVLSWIYQFFVVGWIANYAGEELYYRAALQPKMRGVFGRWNWVASGVGFGLKHPYSWWRVPYLVPVGWALDFLYGPMGSLPLAIFFHWLGNTL